MSGERSLTDAVKLTAGISLTQAVKDAAGSRDWFVDDLFVAQKDSTQATVGRQARRVLAAAPVLTFAFLHTTSSPTGLDAEPRSIAPAQRRVALVVAGLLCSKDTASFDLLDAFVARYGDTFFAELARARIGDLTKGLPPSSPTLLEDGATPRSAN